MTADVSHDQAIYQALLAVDEVAAALQAHLVAEHGAVPDRSGTRTTSTDSLTLLRQARERLGHGLRAARAGTAVPAGADVTPLGTQ
jgi:hypothetical protein